MKNDEKIFVRSDKNGYYHCPQGDKCTQFKKPFSRLYENFCKLGTHSKNCSGSDKKLYVDTLEFKVKETAKFVISYEDED